MNTTDYIELNVTVQPVQPWSDLLISELAEIGYESFEETLKGFKAYIMAADYDEKKVHAIRIPEAEDAEISLGFSTKIINSHNWNQEWESNFEPVDVKGECYIRAPFHQPKEGYTHNILIEPKMSFGTGHHATTTLMVEWMLETPFQGRKVLDMGCGTGILAILAAQKDAKPVVAIDNYPFAYENTLENIEKNNTAHIQAFLGDATLLGKESFDIILANITKNVLKQDMSTYVKVLNTEGLLFISGFFEQDMEEMNEMARKAGLTPMGFKQKQEWVSLMFKKNIYN